MATRRTPEFDERFYGPFPVRSVATVTLSAGGSGYTSAPTLVFTGGGGSGASATAVVGNGEVTAVAMTSGGSGYTSAPTVSFTGGGGTGASASAAIAATASRCTTCSVPAPKPTPGTQFTLFFTSATVQILTPEERYAGVVCSGDLCTPNLIHSMPALLVQQYKY